MTIATTKTLNLAGFLVGVAEAGKSTLVLELVDDWLRRGGWAFVHDPTRSFRVPSYGSWAEYLAAATRSVDDSGLPTLRVAAFSCPWSELVAGVKALARQLNSQHRVRMPMLLVGDEASGIDSSGRTHMSHEDQELWSQRRHFGVAIVVNLQRVKNLPLPFWEQVNHLWVFRLATPKDADIIAEGAQIAPGLMQFATRLPQYRFEHLVLGFERRLSRSRLWGVPA